MCQLIFLRNFEVDEKLCNQAKNKLASFSNVEVVYGQSPVMIAQIAPMLQGKILFWLDAHYSGAGTSLGYNDPNAADAVTAIRGELEAIRGAKIEDCIILIDDIRGFGSIINEQEYLGCWAYPSLQEIHTMLLKINPRFELALLGDILLAYDASQFSPNFSTTVIGCTKTRLYDGHNLSDEQLLQAEEMIKHATARERAYIKQLYSMMTDYKDPMFWHDLWYGLIAQAEGNYHEARKAYEKVMTRKQYLNKNKQPDTQIIRYDHWRLNAYISACHS